MELAKGFMLKEIIVKHVDVVTDLFASQEHGSE